MPRGFRADGTPCGRPKGSRMVNGKLLTPDLVAALEATIAPMRAVPIPEPTPAPTAEPVEVRVAAQGRSKADRRGVRDVPMTIIGGTIDFSALTVGQRIRWLRKALIMSQMDLAERMGLSPNSIAQVSAVEGDLNGWKRGKGDFRPETIQRYAAALGCDPLWLAYGVGDMGIQRTQAKLAVQAAIKQFVARAQAS